MLQFLTYTAYLANSVIPSDYKQKAYDMTRI